MLLLVLLILHVLPVHKTISTESLCLLARALTLHRRWLGRHVRILLNLLLPAVLETLLGRLNSLALLVQVNEVVAFGAAHQRSWRHLRRIPNYKIVDVVVVNDVGDVAAGLVHASTLFLGIGDRGFLTLLEFAIFVILHEIVIALRNTTVGLFGTRGLV